MSMHSNSGVSSETFQKYPTQSEEYERDYYFNGGQSNPPPFKTLGSGVYRVYRARPEPSLDSSFPILTMVLLGIVVIAIFLLSYYIFVIKCRFNWQQLVFLRRFSTLQIPRHEDPRIIVYAPARENHGLDESVIRSIPTVKFKNNDGNLHVCAVCLNEFQENEKLRLLPTCKHAFHIDCIDIWLQTNSNCPLCRSEISRTSPWISIQNPVQNLHEVAINVDDNLNSIVIDVNLQSRPGETGSSPETPLQIANRNSSKIEQKSSFKKQRKLYQTSSMGDECIDTREKNDLFQVQTIRRSFSMDSCSDRQLYLSIQETLQQNRSPHEVCSSECSSRFRRSLFSFGHNRGSKFAILPVHTDL